MRFIILRFLLSMLIMSGTLVISGQDYKLKFGDVPMDDLRMTEYPQDTSASAVFLGDFGDVRFEFNQNDGDFEVVYTRFTRIKIFNKNGYEWADHKIRLYYDGNIKEKLVAFKASTYNLVNGKIEKTKLTRKSVLSEEDSEYWRSESFTMPDVQDNCIIEFEYTIKSNYFRKLPEWNFQQTVPVKWSELNIEIPEYFRYKPLMSGYEALDIRDSNIGRGNITITSKERGGNGVTKTEYNTQTIEFRTVRERLVASEVPAFVSEPMLTSYKNYISKISYELESITFPQRPTTFYAESWESINKKLYENQFFGYQLDGGLYLNSTAEAINANIQDPYDRMVASYETIRNHMKWNNYTGIYATGTLRGAYNDRSGSIADINLMLVVLLEKVGLKVAPVILSTRSNGVINPLFPASTQFNYVIARVTIDGKSYLLDASDHLVPAGMLPERCLNGRGRMVEKGPGDWVDLNTGHIYDYYTQLDLVMDGNGDFSGTLSNNREGYAAYNLRSMIEEEKNEEDLLRKIESNNDGLEITDHSFGAVDSLYNPVTERYSINIVNRSDIAGDIYYVNPMFFEQVRNNPFKLQERLYPIDFSYPRREVYQLTLEIPENWVVEELPKPLKLSLADDGASFEYSINRDGNRLIFVNKFSINKTLFLSDEYQNLKDFYNKIVEKHAEPFIIKKN